MHTDDLWEWKQNPIRTPAAYVDTDTALYSHWSIPKGLGPRAVGRLSSKPSDFYEERLNEVSCNERPRIPLPSR